MWYVFQNAYESLNLRNKDSCICSRIAWRKSTLEHIRAFQTEVRMHGQLWMALGSEKHSNFRNEGRYQHGEEASYYILVE